MAAGGGGANEGKRGEFTGRADVVAAERQPFVDGRGRLRDHAQHSHGVADHGDQFARMRRLGRQRQRPKSANFRGILYLQDGQVSVAGKYHRGETQAGRQLGEKSGQLLELRGGSAANQCGRFRIFIPGLGDVAVGRDQAIGDDEAGAGDANPQRRS